MSGAFLDVDYVGRDREREWGEVRGARVLAAPLARSGGRCLLARRRGEEERGGGRPRSVLRTPRRIGRRTGEARGGRRRLEGGGYSAGAHCSALQSAQMAGMAILYA